MAAGNRVRSIGGHRHALVAHSVIEQQAVGGLGHFNLEAGTGLPSLPRPIAEKAQTFH